MANRKNLYDAFILKTEPDSTQPYKGILVDLFDLPYGEFDSESPLEIWGDVDMGKQKKGVMWPDLSNVIIENDFDCSGFKIESDTVLPRSMAALICLHSINDLGVLIGKLNPDVSDVVVRRAILNDIKKGCEPALSNALEFMRVYPNINVIDENEKISLKEVLLERENEQKKTSGVKPAKAPKFEQKSLPVKNEEWLTVEEMVEVCKSKSDIVAAQDLRTITRYVKKIRSSGVASLRIQDCIRTTDGATLKCIHRGCCDSVLDAVVGLIDEDTTRQGRKKTKTKTGVDTKNQPEKHPQEQKTSGVDLPPVTDIKKYIPKNVWKDICRAAGNDKNFLIGFLKEIEKINVVPRETVGRKVMYVQDGVQKMSSLIDFKSYYRLTQSFGTLRDRQRVIWAVGDNMFVAVNLVEDHFGGKKIYEYKQLMREKTKASLLAGVEYYCVTELLSELDTGRPSFDTPPQSDDFTPSSIDPESQVKEGVKSATAEPDDGDVKNVLKEPNEVIYNACVQLSEVWIDITESQNKIFDDMQKNIDDTEKLMAVTEKLRTVLKSKIRLEALLRAMQDITAEIKKTK